MREDTQVMKLKGIEPNKQIYNSLVRVYGRVCSLPDLPDAYRETAVMDTWKIVEEASARGMVDTILLNNVMTVHANALEVDKLEGLVLPLYEKHGLQMDSYSYEVLMVLHYNLKDFNTAVRMYRQFEKQMDDRKARDIEVRGEYAAKREVPRDDMRQTFNMLETLLQIGIRMMDMPMVLEALAGFKKINRHPKNSSLKFLGNLKGLPEEIQVSLMEFKIRFGAAKMKKTKTNSEGPVKDPQDD